MCIEFISGDLSRSIAADLCPETSNGRSLCRMAADKLGTTVETIHMALIVFAAAIYLTARK